MGPLLREHHGFAVVILPQLARGLDLLVLKLVENKRRIEDAFMREPLIIRLNSHKCEARRHEEPEIPYTVRGNGSLKAPPETPTRKK